MTTRIGKYELVRRLGGGGMAEVFLAKAIDVEGFAQPIARVLPSYSAELTRLIPEISDADLLSRVTLVNTDSGAVLAEWHRPGAV